jgi:PAS domain S-box-containing protein
MATNGTSQGRRAHPMVRINYAIRAGSFAYSFVVLAIHGVERGFGAGFWALLVLQFLVYPHLAWLHARRAPDPKGAEQANIYADALMLGGWIGALHFPLWLAFGALFSTTLNAAVVLGIVRGAWSVAAFGGGAAIGMAFAGPEILDETSRLVTALCFAGALAYSAAVGAVVHMLRGRLAESENRYRLLADHAADLVAIVDRDARWIYASPSFESVLAGDDLVAGSDALARAHPEDASHARIALLRSAATGKPRDLPLRLVDRDGRIRQYKATFQPVRKEALPANRLVVALRDVTDLRESEEQLLVAAHALEGMTEAIMITSVDGTVQKVNRAFTAVTGYTSDEVLGRPESELHGALQPPSFYQEVYAAVEREGYWSGTTWSRRKNGSVYREWRSVRIVRDANAKPTHYVIVFYELGTPPVQLSSNTGSSTGFH